MRPDPDPLTLDDLRVSPHLEPLSDEQLQWLIDHGEAIRLDVDDRIIEPGDPALHMLIMLEGEGHVYRQEGGHRKLFVMLRQGDVSGLLPYSRLERYQGWGVAVEPMRVLQIHKDHFPEMLRMAPELGKRLVGLMSDRVRETTRTDQQREKMVSLGKLAAGLAHELNNPASAVRRSAAELQDRRARMPGILGDLLRERLSPESLDAAHALIADAEPPARLSSLERGEREDDLADWLDDHDVDEGWVLAETLVDAGIGPDELDAFAERVSPEALPAAVRYIEGTVAARHILDDIASAAGRISDLVAAVKTYSHMDQAPDRRLVDVHDGLESTLKMLGHKIKTKQIRLERDYADDAPAVPLFVSEMNQVWTNLIDNAVDAVDEGGALTVRTGVEGGHLTVQVIDDGPGIPPDVRERIFDPFFTTKGVGEGTGLGLDIVRRILEQHGAAIDVDSEPGCTVFAVRLPLEVA